MSDRNAQQRLTHQSAESLKGTRDSYMRVDLNKDTLCSVDVDLQQTRFVKRRIQEGQQALGANLECRNDTSYFDSTHLMGNVRTSISNISTSLCEDALVIVTVEESVFDIAFSTALAFAST